MYEVIRVELKLHWRSQEIRCQECGDLQRKASDRAEPTKESVHVGYSQQGYRGRAAQVFWISRIPLSTALHAGHGAIGFYVCPINFHLL